MQHYHRNRHRLIWLILAPVALVLLILAIVNRPEWPEMETLPGASITTGSVSLEEIYVRGASQGVESLTDDERDHYRIQAFFLYRDNGGLSGFFYNKLPDLAGIHETVAAMNRQNRVELAKLLETATDVFRDFRDPDPPTTWGAVLEKWDPNDRLSAIDRQMDPYDRN